MNNFIILVEFLIYFIKTKITKKVLQLSAG